MDECISRVLCRYLQQESKRIKYQKQHNKYTTLIVIACDSKREYRVKKVTNCLATTVNTSLFKIKPDKTAQKGVCD